MLSWCCQYECAYYDGAYHCKACGAKKIMAEIWKPESIKVYQEWIKCIIEEASDELSSWESDFIDSIDNRLTKGFNLTQAQALKLESIYADKTS